MINFIHTHEPNYFRIGQKLPNIHMLNFYQIRQNPEFNNRMELIRRFFISQYFIYSFFNDLDPIVPPKIKVEVLFFTQLRVCYLDSVAQFEGQVLFTQNFANVLLNLLFQPPIYLEHRKQPIEIQVNVFEVFVGENCKNKIIDFGTR